MKLRTWLGPLSVSVSLGSAWAAPVPAMQPLVDRLETIREQTTLLEKNLVEALRSKSEARANLVRIKKLLVLGAEEKRLTQSRIEGLERAISELELRRGALREKIALQKKSVRSALRDIDRSSREIPQSENLHQRELIEAPRRRVLSNWVDRSIQELAAFRVDLDDAQLLEGKIQEEKQQLTYYAQELQEREAILQLNQKLQTDLLLSRGQERLAQLETYQKLRSAQSNVERMIRDFNARMELQDAIETERKNTRQQLWMQSENERIAKSLFFKKKGTLNMPVEGQVISFFGRSMDPKTQLTIFKKGIEIQAGASQPVRAIFAGKVVFSGEMPGLGRISIIDHGDHFYSLCGKMGALSRQVGDSVAQGEVLGQSAPSGDPVYFEIRSRNIAINPLQWVTHRTIASN